MLVAIYLVGLPESVLVSYGQDRCLFLDHITVYTAKFYPIMLVSGYRQHVLVTIALKLCILSKF